MKYSILARCQGLAAGRPKIGRRGQKPEVEPHFENTVLDVCSNQGAKREMVGHRFQIEGPGTTGPPLATTLTVLDECCTWGAPISNGGPGTAGPPTGDGPD